MTKEQENLIKQRIESKRWRRLKARFNGKRLDTVRNPGYTIGKGEDSHEYRSFASQW